MRTKRKFPRLCLSSCTGALRDVTLYCSVAWNFDEVCQKISMMYTPHRNFQAALTTYNFYLLWVSIVTGKCFFWKVQFICYVFLQASKGNLTRKTISTLTWRLAWITSQNIRLQWWNCHRYRWQIRRWYWVANLLSKVGSKFLNLCGMTQPILVIAHKLILLAYLKASWKPYARLSMVGFICNIRDWVSGVWKELCLKKVRGKRFSWAHIPFKRLHATQAISRRANAATNNLGCKWIHPLYLKT